MKEIEAVCTVTTRMIMQVIVLQNMEKFWEMNVLNVTKILASKLLNEWMTLFCQFKDNTDDSQVMSVKVRIFGSTL